MSVDWTKSTHATDARGNKVRVDFVKVIDDELVFAFLEPFHNGVMMRAPCQKVFGSDGKHLSEKTITLCPPEPEEPPVWALKRACEEAGSSLGQYETYSLTKPMRASIRAHAITLAKHEEGPVDPDLVKAREYAAQHWEALGENEIACEVRNADHDDSEGTQAALLAVQGERA